MRWPKWSSIFFRCNVKVCPVFNQGAGKLTDRAQVVSFFMNTISKVLTLGLAAAGLCLTSCETLDNRISEHPDMFNSLSPRDQALVRQGQIRSGISTNAVRQARRAPEHKEKRDRR